MHRLQSWNFNKYARGAVQFFWVVNVVVTSFVVVVVVALA